MMTGAQLIARERREQIEKHGKTVTKDRLNNPGAELPRAALRLVGATIGGQNFKWPGAWKPEICGKIDAKPDLEKLIIAGAFIAAEIDRRLAEGEKLEVDPQDLELLEVARPLIQLLAEKYHPHHTAIVTNTGVELLEGVQSFNKIMDYIKD
jgi:hypothetical protein